MRGVLKSIGLMGIFGVSMMVLGVAVEQLNQAREFQGILAQESPRQAPAAPMTATYYAEAYHGRLTASGERFDMNALTAAHRTLPFGTRLRVEYQGRSVIVRITDRGPEAWTGRDLDLSKAAFAALAPLSLGVIQVSTRRVE